MPSGTNAFEISDIQEENPVLTMRPESNVTLFLAKRRTPAK
jgi:hypothetical protein